MRQNPGHRTLLDMLAHFRPDYLVLRPTEYADGLKRGYPWLQTDYEILRDYRVPEEQVHTMLFPGYNIDLAYRVLRHRQGA